MRINQNYKLRLIAGQYYLIPVADTEGIEGPILITETAAWIWSVLEAGMPRERIAPAMTEEFEVDQKTAGQAVGRFLEALASKGILETEPGGPGNTACREEKKTCTDNDKKNSQQKY